MAFEKILVIDDDLDLLEIITLYLEKNNFHCIPAETGRKAFDLIEKENPDLIILDVMLPDINGIQVCEKIRNTSMVPIIFLSGKSEVEDRITGLLSGGDDYIVKPFSSKELIARVKSNLKRNNHFGGLQNKGILIYDKLKIDINRYMVNLGNNIINLSNVDFDILKLLASQPGKIFSMEEIYSNVWKVNSLGDTRTVMVHISNIRKKIEKDPTNPQYILTVRGVGYKFNDEFSKF